ncbi:CoA transferase [Microbacterium protaetiae]|uniref:CoA transferase n=1 Tax=Microbacterium protaetiae TaxID=2509458 RepID=A0A4P6EHT2_9MICO|nr:CoA transferase [Microbacterium protaetiae]QAY61083.1 CoA transferase [Microbacterium protaetiae]
MSSSRADAAEGAGEPRLPLTGVRVLELGNYIAAPTAGRLLADFGAEVIKVERPGTGDELRNWRLYEGTTSMLFHTINRNKKSMALDLRSEAGRRLVLELVEHCDILLENFRPGTLEKWGLGPDELREANPDLILTRVSAYGQTGPMATQPGFAAVAEAMGGFRALVGDPDRPPVRAGVSIGDSIAGLYAAFGAVMHLFARERDSAASIPSTRRLVDVALTEAVFSMMESLLPDMEAYGVERTRTGGRLPGIAPSNAFLCRDGSIVIAGNGDSIFQRLMEIIGRSDLAADPTLATNQGRVDRQDEIEAAINAWTSNQTSADALRVLGEAGVPSGPIYTAADIGRDPQYAQRGMVQRRAVWTGERTIENVGFPGVVPLLGEKSLPLRSLGPRLGEHTEQVCHDLLGWTDSEIRSLLEGDAAA